MLKKENILGVGITIGKSKKILEYFIDCLRNEKRPFYLVTPNPEILVYAHSHLDYKDKLNAALLSLQDGSGLTLAGMIEGKRLGERFSGTDFIEELCKACEKGEFGLREKPISMGFLGGRGRVAELTAECLKKKYPSITVAYVGEEWQSSVDGKKIEPFDILFVAFGAPKQEEWIVKNLASLPIKAAMGVGGAFDYYSGNIQRAPEKMRAMGLEWLFRLLRQPWRIKRQFALVIFILLIIRERFSARPAIS